MDKLCACGCGQSVPESNTYLHGHAGAAKVRRTVRYIVDPDTGCWIWQLYKADGYGIVKDGDKAVKAHRYYYKILVGPIPEGCVLDHVKERCKRRDCVNPEHLQPVTSRVNTQRSKLAKIDQQKADMIRSLSKEGFSATNISRQFKLSLSCVCDVLRGTTWNAA